MVTSQLNSPPLFDVTCSTTTWVLFDTFKLTFNPGAGKYLIIGSSRGVKRKNSRPFLYHFNEYNGSLSWSKRHSNIAVLPASTAGGIITLTSFKPTQPAIKRKGKNYCNNFPPFIVKVREKYECVRLLQIKSKCKLSLINLKEICKFLVDCGFFNLFHPASWRSFFYILIISLIFPLLPLTQEKLISIVYFLTRSLSPFISNYKAFV